MERTLVPWRKSHRHWNALQALLQAKHEIPIQRRDKQSSRKGTPAGTILTLNRARRGELICKLQNNR